MTRDPAESDFTYPLLFLATSGHKPGKTRGHGLHLYNSMRSRGIDVKTLIGDRAYFPGARVQDLQGPLAKAGVKVVMDYKTTELGIQASYNSKDGRHKLIMVGGNWYMACMPSTLVFLEQTHQARLAAIEELPEEAQSAARAEAEALATKRRNSRSKYHLKPRSNFDQTGARQYTYPTFKSDEVEFDPESGEVVELKVPGKTVKVPGNLSNRPGVLNQRHLKYHQEFEYGSDEQRAWFGQRNNVENGNSRLKDADREALGVAMKRRVRGPWFVEARCRIRSCKRKPRSHHRVAEGATEPRAHQPHEQHQPRPVRGRPEHPDPRRARLSKRLQRNRAATRVPTTGLTSPRLQTS